MEQHLDPGRIMQTATAFWASKVLLSAVELDLFSTLGEDAMTARDLGRALKLHPRGTFDFFDSLVAMGFLQRDGDGAEARYSNTPETAAFLIRSRPTYIGGMAEMLNARLFGFWNNLTTALKTGEAQSETSNGDKSFFEELYADPDRLEQFLQAMSSFQAANFSALAEKFDFSAYHSVADIGGALGLLCQILARHHPHLSLTSFDLPPVRPLAEASIEKAGLSARITVMEGNFFQDPLPKAEVITMGNILHDWNLEKKKYLIRKVFDALPDGGAFIAIENLIDDARRENIFGLLMSLNMLIELGDAFDYSAAQFRDWCGEAGFHHVEVLPLTGPTSAAIAYK
ncbi:methyltransferase [Luteithermobacter gelatinilyticus]|uniref:methyltransferase n=1 Tax=Luteithermobacter gelatinilyticus TaxID=2582913 RepID=UPI001107173D|nr:methyltransferase [Luteithermobacter gelatinilyticus]|tara:strand:- start:4997 stop:6022 length:1026 start_codon:yes stop_codon:yes gene_type:complete